MCQYVLIVVFGGLYLKITVTKLNSLMFINIDITNITKRKLKV